MKFHSTKILILIVICNIVAIAGYYFLFQHIKTQAQAASLLINALDVSQQKDSRLNSLRSVIKDTQVQRQQLVTFLLSSDAEISFIEQIEALAKNSGLTEKTNNVSSVAGGADAIKTLQMQIGTTGSWNNTLYFLSQVENLPFDVHVQGVSINKASSSWTATFDINVTETK
jgi:Tfp pilus assembly protein PilO